MPTDKASQVMMIRPAVEHEARDLSALAQRAKAHWGYAPEQLDRWRAELSITSSDIQAKPVFVAVVEERVAGFYSLAVSASSWELEQS